MKEKPTMDEEIKMNNKQKPTVKQFGKDHWSIFAYIETRIVDYKGKPHKPHMRCDVDRHPQHDHQNLYPEHKEVTKYPTRLRGYFEDKTLKLDDHDDWDCIDDCIAEGLLREPPDRGTGLSPVYELTDRGADVASQLRVHKSEGKNFASFTPVF